MRYLDARLEPPDWMRHPMQQFLVDSPAMERAELLAWNHSREDVQLALFRMTGDIAAYGERIADVEPIEWFDLTPIDDRAFYSYVCHRYTDADVAFFEAFAELHLVVVPPLVYDADGGTQVTVVGRGAALTELVAALEERADVGVTVREVGEYDRQFGRLVGGLSDRQFEALAVASELGYYAVPRDASLAAVAAELDVVESTASELLRRAEAAVVPRVVRAETVSD